MAVAITTAIGKRYLERYAAGEITREKLDEVYAKGTLISDADYQAAIAAPAE